MHIETDDPLVQSRKFHHTSVRNTLDCGRRGVPKLQMPAGDELQTLCLTCALDGGNPGHESVRRITLARGVKPSNNIAPR